MLRQLTGNQIQTACDQNVGLVPPSLAGREKPQQDLRHAYGSVINIHVFLFSHVPSHAVGHNDTEFNTRAAGIQFCSCVFAGIVWHRHDLAVSLPSHNITYV